MHAYNSTPKLTSITKEGAKKRKKKIIKYETNIITTFSSQALQKLSARAIQKFIIIDGSLASSCTSISAVVGGGVDKLATGID
jgi:hypothetical protein